MRIELEIQGVDVQFVVINAFSGLEQQEKLLKKSAIPMLQDLDTVGAWDLMAGKKDDFYIFDAEGNLATYLPIGGEVDVNLGGEEGYANLQAAILEVAQ